MIYVYVWTRFQNLSTAIKILKNLTLFHENKFQETHNLYIYTSYLPTNI